MNSQIITLSQFFDFLSFKYGTKFHLNEINELPANTFFVKDETGENVEINAAIKKIDNVLNIRLDSGKMFRCAKFHIVPVNGENLFAKNLIAGDYLTTSTGVDKIVEIIDEHKTEDMFDISVSSNTHLYQTADGVIHHNTSWVKDFSQLTGIELIVIEAPHITEEHIINIPFIMFNPITGQQKKGATSVAPTGATEVEKDDEWQEFRVVLSDSNLFSQINKAKNVPDAQYLKELYAKGRPDTIKMFESLHGEQDTVPNLIDKARKNFKVILFLDEFFRAPSAQIKNMLRGILNNKIGMHDLPKGTYTIYASNLKDKEGSVDEMPKNFEFEQVDFEAPNKDDWFGYLTSKFEKDNTGVKLNKKVIDTFYDLLTDEKLNFNDVSADVRSSPRRWEQLLLYINAAFPIDNEEDAQSLMTNVKTNFRNYLKGSHSEIAKEVLDATSKLIKDISGYSISPGDVHPATEWRKTLEHQIKMKMKLGHNRKYVPIISGEPGIGKTAIFHQIVTDLNLAPIYIDCTPLNPEDVSGIPLANTKGDTVETTFSESKLYKLINNQVMKADEMMKEQMKEKYGKEKGKADAEFKKWKDGDWKYLLFFDELNRIKPKVFNGIRKLLLEKEYGDGTALEPKTIVMAAINPKDIGTTDLTSHMRDVVDIIHSAPNWKHTIAYLNNIKFPTLENDSVKDIIFSTIIHFVDKFKVTTTDKDITAAEKPFYLNIGSKPVYISPREYTSLYANSVKYVDAKVTMMMNENDFEKLTADEGQKLLEEFKLDIYRGFENKLKNILHKHNARNPEFLKTLKEWILTTTEIDFGEGLFTKRGETVDFESFMRPYYENQSLDLSKEQAFINYLQNSDPVEFKEKLTSFLVDEVKKDEEVIAKVTTRKHPKKVLDEKGKIQFQKQEVSKMEHFIREVVHAMKINKLDGGFRNMVKEGFIQFIDNIPKGDAYFEDLLDFNDQMHAFLASV